MKINKYLGALLIAAPAFVACSDDTGIESGMPAASVGDYITFGGSVGFDNADQGKTRTIYGDEGTFNGTKGTEIRWYEGDKVAIYCAEALENKLAHYSVVDYQTGYDATYEKGNGGADGTIVDRDTTRLEPTGGTPGLKWGSEDGNHTFYAVYPSPAMFDALSQVAQNFSLEGSTFTGYLPSYQAPSTYDDPITYEKYGDSALHVIRPAMQYAYMAAKDVTTAQRPYTNLTFNPLVTAVEFTITNDCYMEVTETTGGQQTKEEPQAIPNIQQITISSTDGTAIAGKFTTTNIGESNMATSIATADAITSITVPTLGTDQRPITLQPYESIRFTVFMLPNKDGKDVDLSKLKIDVLTGIANKSAVLSLAEGDNRVLVQAKKKNFLSGIKLRWDVRYTDINWMSQLPGDIKLGDLSIPGAGGAGSHTMSEGRNQQTLPIDSLWNLGVRCFEMFVDHAGSTSSLANQKLVCNGQESDDLTISDAVEFIKDKLEDNPREFAIVTIGYQPVNRTRSAVSFQGGLKNFWDDSVNDWSVTTTVKNDAGNNITCGPGIYNPNETLDNARGKLFLLSRPNGIGRDQWWYSLAAQNNGGHTTNALEIMGWGPSPDFFYSRGYTKNTRPYYINQTGNFDGLETSTPTNGGDNYFYPSYKGGLKAADDGFLTYSTYYTWEGWKDSCKIDDKFMYRIMDHTRSAAGAVNTYGYTTFNDTLFAYIQDWRRVSKGFKYPEGTSEAPEPSYKIALNVRENSNYISSFTVNSVTINGEEIETTNSEGYYELDLGTTLPTSRFNIEVDITGTYRYNNNNRTATDDHTYTYAVDPSELEYTNNLYTVTATATRTNTGSNRDPIYTITLEGSITGPTEYGSDDESSSSTTYYYYWPDSRAEKENDVYQALIKATTAGEKRYRTIFINSLCGFFITENELSYKPEPMRLMFQKSTSTSSSTILYDVKYNGETVNGVTFDKYYTDDSNIGAYHLFGGTYGDISDFSQYMNNFFYGKLLEIGANNLQGPTGIILCDRISNDPKKNEAGYYISQIIIANNFKQYGTGSSTNSSAGKNDGDSDEPEAGVAPRKTLKQNNKTADNHNALVVEWK